MRARLLLALFLPLAACGEDAAPQEPRLENPGRYFGLQACKCYVYGADGTDERVGVGIERTVDLGNGIQALELRFRDVTGAVFRTELVRPTSPDLELHEVLGRGSTPAWRLLSPLPLVRWPPEARSSTPLQLSFEGQYRDGSSTMATPFDVALRSDYARPAVVEFRRGEEPETAEGVRIAYQLTTESGVTLWHQGARTFVPDVGFVRFEQLTASDTGPARTWDLRAVHDYDAACPYEMDPPVTQICGRSPLD